MGSTKLTVAYRKTLVSLAFWTLGDGGHKDPVNKELTKVLKNILISAQDAGARPHTLNQNEHRVVQLTTGGKTHAALGDSGEALRIGWDSEMKEGQNETQDFRYSS